MWQQEELRSVAHEIHPKMLSTQEHQKRDYKLLKDERDDDNNDNKEEEGDDADNVAE